MGDEGLPQGVSTSRVAASVKPGSDEMPVPPITAICTGAARVVSNACEDMLWGQYHRRS
jgi:hypothetical protein